MWVQINGRETMKEIKFRVWSTKPGQIPEKVMLYLDPIAEGNKGRFSGNDLATGSNWQVMQYTGLKDKNGVGIYEGDIVQYNTGEIWFVEWVVRYAGFAYVNKLIKDESGIGKQSGIGSAQIPGGHEVGVIGNIYTNPELLK